MRDTAEPSEQRVDARPTWRTESWREALFGPAPVPLGGIECEATEGVGAASGVGGDTLVCSQQEGQRQVLFGTPSEMAFDLTFYAPGPPQEKRMPLRMSDERRASIDMNWHT